MIRISNNISKILSIKRYFSENDAIIDIDSFIIIPGVTIYNSIYQQSNSLVFAEQKGNTIVVEFSTPDDVERFFAQLVRDTKLNQLIDTKNNH